MHLSILSIYLSIIDISIYISIYVYLYLSIYLFIYLSVYLFTFIPSYLYIFIYLSIYLSYHLPLDCVCLNLSHRGKGIRSFWIIVATLKQLCLVQEDGGRGKRERE